MAHAYRKDNASYHFMDDASILVLTGLEKERNNQQILAEILTLCFLCASSVMGNILVCVVVYRSRRVQSTTNFFVVSIAVSDLLYTVMCMPFVGVRVSRNRWIFGGFMCKLVRFLQYVFPTTSVYVLVAILIDRFYTIIYPLSFKVTKSTAKRMILAAWLVPILFSSVVLYFFETESSVLNNSTEICPTYINNQSWPGISYSVVLVVVQYICPFVILIIGYIKLFRYIWTLAPHRRSFQRTTNPVPIAKVKMVKMLIVVTMSTMTLFAPFYFVQLWLVIFAEILVNPTIFVFNTWCCLGTNVIKTMIYLKANSNFRRGCKEVMCMSALSCYRSNIYAVTNASVFSKRNHIGVIEPSSNSKGTDSPIKAFNRAEQIKINAWPLAMGKEHIPLESLQSDHI